MKKYAKRFLNDLGIQISRGPSLFDFLKSRRIDMVFDVGANEGQFARSLRDGGFKGEMVSFEPMGQAFAALATASANDPLWSVEKVGVGDVRAELELNVSKKSVFNSFLPQTILAGEFDADSVNVATETVPVKPLDDYLSRADGRHLFLKIDTQGFEQKVILGASKILSLCLGVQMELPIAHLYKDVWELEEAISQMRRLGFVIAQLRPVNFDSSDPTTLLELDCVFKRKAVSVT